MKIHSVGAEFFHADGRTDMTKLNRHVSQSCESAYYCTFCPHTALIRFVSI